MRQFLFWIEIAVFALACVLFFVGERFQSLIFTLLGAMSLGLLALILGAEVFVKRQASFSRRRGGHVVGSETYSGCAAQLWGAMFVLFGLGLVFGALVGILDPQQAQAFLDQALETPPGWGILSAGLGFFISTYGLTRLLAGGTATIKNGWGRLREVGYRLFGGLCLLIGGGLIMLGLALIFSPGLVTTFVRQWIQLDLGKPVNVSMIRLFISQFPEGQTIHQIWVGANPDDLTMVKEFQGFTTEPSTLEFAPTTPLTNVQYIKNVTTQSPSWVAWREIEVIGE